MNTESYLLFSRESNKSLKQNIRTDDKSSLSQMKITYKEKKIKRDAKVAKQVI